MYSLWTYVGCVMGFSEWCSIWDVKEDEEKGSNMYGHSKKNDGFPSKLDSVFTKNSK